MDRDRDLAEVLDEVRQVIVVRKDLNMRKGKIGAQCAHASLAVFFERMHHPYHIDELEANGSEHYSKIGECYQYIIDLSPEMHEWKEGIFKKIVVYVTSEEELLAVYDKARSLSLPCSLIQDQGHTEFHGVPTYTTCAIGPARKSILDVVTGELPLY